ncbi:hypothetical protein M8C21_031474 [Ambrosia artemisiifolia]|uniref:Uncharacterized protein n=1 Tax=Ambrosia artemisiifolia TaxID=4212 RepID=A0AAD5GUB1_AMBAR|nr:hypothetical protein M8C21_031474 [Ambrosia artemisiifolia]
MVASTRSSKRGHRELSTLVEVACLSSGLRGDGAPGPSTGQRKTEPIYIGSSTGAKGTSLCPRDRKKNKRPRVKPNLQSDDKYVSETPPHRTMANAPHKHSWGRLKTRGGAGGPSDSSDSSEDGEWVIARVSPRTADRVPTDDGMNIVTIAGDDGLPHGGVDTSAATEMVFAASACLTPDVKTIETGKEVRVTGQGPSSMEKEMDAHRRKFGLETIWTSNDRATCESEPSQFQLRDNPGGEGNGEAGGDVSGTSGVTELVAKTAKPDALRKEQERVAGLSQPSFNLGITQEVKESVSPGGEVCGTGIEICGVPELVAKKGKPDGQPKEQDQDAGNLLRTLKNTSYVQETLPRDAVHG